MNIFRGKYGYEILLKKKEQTLLRNDFNIFAEKFVFTKGIGSFLDSNGRTIAAIAESENDIVIYDNNENPLRILNLKEDNMFYDNLKEIMSHFR